MPAAQAPHEPTPLELRPAAVRDPVRDEGPIRLPGTATRRPELREDSCRVLPGPGDGAQKSAVAGPGIPVKGAEVGHHLGPERIEVQITDEFLEVRLGFHHDGLVPVLEEVATALMAAVEGPRVAGEEAPHAPGTRPPGWVRCREATATPAPSLVTNPLGFS